MTGLYRALKIASTAATVALVTACAGGSAASAQSSVGSQSAGYVPQSAGIAAAPPATPAGKADQPLPDPLIALGNPAFSRNITSPIINDSAAYTNGAIIVGTDTVNGYGVEGVTKGSGAGLYGHSGSSSATSYGVYGYSPGRAGLYGYDTKSGSGVLGVSVDGAGVQGETEFPSNGSTSFAQAGVLGQDKSTDFGSYDAGVAGISANGSGVYGTSNNFAGVWGTTASQNGYGMIAQSTSTSSASNAALLVIGYGGTSIETVAATADSSSATMYVDGSGNMTVAGNLTVNGTINGAIASPAITSPGRGEQIESVGDGQLSGGTAYVPIDAAFAKRLDASQPYHVFVTPDGDSPGWLYVSGKTATGFTVRESHSGSSSIAFDYRIVGTARKLVLPRPKAVYLPGRLAR